jgi:hypothetical protein
MWLVFANLARKCEPFLGSNVGWIGDNQICRFGKCFQQVRLKESDVVAGSLVPGVGAGNV